MHPRRQWQGDQRLGGGTSAAAGGHLTPRPRQDHRSDRVRRAIDCDTVGLPGYRGEADTTLLHAGGESVGFGAH